MIRTPAESAGTRRRLGRLENDGMPVIIVAMDQGIAGLPTGFTHPEDTIRTVLAAEPDGILLNVGMARRVAPLLAHRHAPGLVVSIDQVIHEGRRGSGPAVAQAAFFTVEEAIRLGADAVKTMLIMGREDRAEQLKNMSYLASAAEACRRWEMPFMIEPYLWGNDVPNDPVARAQLGADGARIAVELGADLLKVEYAGDADAFGELVAASPVPVLVLGGPKRETSREVVAEVIAAMGAGAAGITMGRNIWQQPDPTRMMDALRVAMTTGDIHAAMAALEPEDEQA